MSASILTFPIPAWQPLLNVTALPYNRGVYAVFEDSKSKARVAWVFWSARFSEEAPNGEAYEIDGEDTWVGPSEIWGWADDARPALKAADLIRAEYAP